MADISVDVPSAIRQALSGLPPEYFVNFEANVLGTFNAGAVGIYLTREIDPQATDIGTSLSVYLTREIDPQASDIRIPQTWLHRVLTSITTPTVTNSPIPVPPFTGSIGEMSPITLGLGGHGLITRGFGRYATPIPPSLPRAVLFDPFKKIRQRGIQFANVLDKVTPPDPPIPGIFRGVQQAASVHTNTVMPIFMEAGENPSRVSRGGSGPRNGDGSGGGGFGGGGGSYSGAIKYRFRNYKNFGVPSSINIGAEQETFPFTGPPGPPPVPFSCSLSWSLGPNSPRQSYFGGYSKFPDGRVVFLQYATGSDGDTHRRAYVYAADGQSVVEGGISSDPRNSASVGYFYPGEMCTLGDGRILRYGESIDIFVGVFAETFSSATLQWTAQLTASDREFYDELGSDFGPSTGHTLITLNDGNAFKVGGNVNNGYVASGSTRFNYASNTWTQRAHMSIGRENHTATKLQDGRVLVVGGIEYPPYFGDVSKSGEIYDPGSDTWTGISDMNDRRRDHSAVLLPNGKVLVVGSAPSGSFPDFIYSSSYSSEVYDPIADSWTPTPLRSILRFSPALHVMDDGFAYLLGGTSNQMVEMYNWTTNTWSDRGNSLLSHVEGRFGIVYLSGCAILATEASSVASELSELLPHVSVAPQGHILDGNTEALWRVDELLSTDDLTDIANGHTIQEFGIPPSVPGQIDGGRAVGNTAWFQGIGNSSMGQTFSGSWTIEMWLNLASTAPATADAFIYNGLDFSIFNDHTIMAELQVETDGHLTFHQWHNPSSFTAGSSAGSITPNLWHHVALSKNDQGSNTHIFKIYIDGVLDSSYAAIPGMDFSISGSGHFIGFGNFIGSAGFGTSPGNPFYGDMDDTRISKVVRTDAEILESYVRGRGVP